MIVPAALAAYAVLVAVGAGRLLAGAGWTDRAPRLAVLLWQALTASVILAAGLAGLSVAMSSLTVSGGLGQVLHACALLLHEQYAAPGGDLAAFGGLVLAALVVVRILWALGRSLVVGWARRRVHLDALTIVGRRVSTWDAVVVDHPRPAAYCLPGRRHRVVITSAALRSLTNEEMAAVLAHEQTHVRERHHLVIAGAEAAVRAFPSVPLFDVARPEIARLLEMIADDAAARRGSRSTVADALARVAEGWAPAEAIAAGGPTAPFRVRRMLSPVRPVSGAVRLCIGLLAALLLLGPVLVALAPAVVALTGSYAHTCPIPGL